MKLKVNKIGIAASAIIIAGAVIGGGIYNTSKTNTQQSDPNVSAATNIYNTQTRDGLAVNSGELNKLSYNYRATTNRTQQTEVQDFSMIYVFDDSASRSTIMPIARAGVLGFVNSIDKTKNGFGVISYSDYNSESGTKNRMGEELLNAVNINTIKHTERGSGTYYFTDNNALPQSFKDITNELPASRQKVLVFESDFMDFGAPYRSHEGFINNFGAELKALGYKVVLIGDGFTERVLTPIEDGFSYKISSTKADGSFMDRGDILRMFVQTTTKETHSSPNTKYELSLRGTSYKFSPAFLAEVRKNNKFVVEGEDFIRLKVPEFNAQNAAGTKAADVNVSFAGVDVVYRNNNTAPAAVEYLSVAKDSATDRIAINFVRPETKEQTVYVQDSVQAKDSISNTDALPATATFAFKEEVDTSKAGKLEVTIIATYGDGMVLEVPAIINVLPKSNVTVKYLDTSGNKIADEKTLFEKPQPEGTKYKAEKLNIAGYKFLKMDEKSAQEEGEIGEENLQVIFLYEKIVEAPNTGAQSLTTLATVLAGMSILGIATTFFVKRK